MPIRKYLQCFFSFSIVIGCLAGGIYACLNGGTCYNNNGVGACSCQSGYGGTYCATGLGCNAGGSYACQNGGTCIVATGICSCLSGYSGTYCSTGKLNLWMKFSNSKYSFSFSCWLRWL